MTLFNIKSLKNIAALGTMFFFVSCSNEITSSADGLINNSNFKKDTISINPEIETAEVDFVPSSLLSTYLIGDYTNSNFGAVNAGFVGQITADSYPVKRTTNEVPEDVTTIDVSAVLEIPLSFTLKEDSTEELELINALGDFATVFDFKVSTFETYLERFNADGSTRTYYSNGKNSAGTKEDLGALTELGVLTGYSFSETYTAADTLRIPLDSYDFATEFLAKLDQNPLATNDEMRAFFKGLKLEVTKTSGDGLVFPVDLTAAKLKINYTNQEADQEDAEKELSFSLNGALHNLYNHNHVSANIANEVYVQGASGYQAKVDISSLINEHSVTSQEESWLINQATLKIYLKDADDYSKVLSSLLIYAIDDEGTATAIDDYFYLGTTYSFVDGIVRFEDTENETEPYVRFFITDLVKEALASGEVTELRIKESRGETTFVDLRSTTAKGLVMLNDVNSTTKAPQLELIYSKIK
ncbi:hypothetical protein FHR24_000118 [Wenyingzhuangia heitensis]|uniref:DUF4270 domain-containing protein n=1 Tax=Wenyingzhuangia heitensis TaxID=1487859 RepID=A0ABX0U4B4_9FLAO|nr:DUF4270 family protein [Wenyingzhuangia heitensis]NIJ43679.1 hypothetical protein [Wenyingzhuangia heitensis]